MAWFISHESGQAALGIIILISSLIMEFVLAMLFINYFFSTADLGEKLSSRALAVSRAGIDDAFIKLSRDKEFLSSSYNLNIGNDQAVVSMSRVVSGNSYLITVTSLGTAMGRQRKLVGLIIVDQTTGKIMLQSLNEQPL